MKSLVLLLLAAISLPAMAQVPSNVPTAGLVAWYGLAGDADDAGANGLDGTLSSTTATTDRYNAANSALAFSFFSYVAVPSNALFNTGDEMTVTAWVRLNDASANQKVLGRTDGAFDSGFILGVDGGQLSPELWDGNGVPHSFVAGTVPSATWTHLAITWSASGGLTGYINGTSVQNIIGDAAPLGPNSDDLIIGGSPWSQSPLYFPVNGSIDDVGIWDRVLTQNELTGLVAPQTGVGDITSGNGPAVTYDAAHGLVTIVGTQAAGATHYTIVDALGNVVRTDRLGAGNTLVPVNTLPTGVYFVRLDGPVARTVRFVQP